MRRPVVVVLVALLAVITAACSDHGDHADDEATDAAAPDTTGTDGAAAPTTGRPTAEPNDDPDVTAPSAVLAPLLLTEDDLPGGFEPSDDVDDSLTTMCAGQDATAGLQATDRAVVGFRSDPPGQAVVQIVLELTDTGAAATFVEQARDLLDSCDGVPDLAGLGFEYEPVDPGVEALLADSADAHAARRGTSVGSGAFVIDQAFFHHGPTAQLVAVIGVDQPPEDLLDAALAVVLARSARR